MLDIRYAIGPAIACCVHYRLSQGFEGFASCAHYTHVGNGSTQTPCAQSEDASLSTAIVAMSSKVYGKGQCVMISRGDLFPFACMPRLMGQVTAVLGDGAGDASPT